MNTDKTHSCVCDFITNAEAIPIEFWFSLGHIKEYKCSYCNSIYKSQLELHKLTTQQIWIYCLPCIYWVLDITRFAAVVIYCIFLFIDRKFIDFIGFTIMVYFIMKFIMNFILCGRLIATESLESHINKMYKDRIDLCVKAFSKS